MSVETRKVLDMLAEGKISAEQADQLLEKLGAPGAPKGGNREGTETASSVTPRQPRFMRIVVEKPGEEDVNVRLPLDFARNGTRLMAVLSPHLREKLGDLGDLSEWSQNLCSALGNSNIEVEKGNKKVRIFYE